MKPAARIAIAVGIAIALTVAYFQRGPKAVPDVTYTNLQGQQLQQASLKGKVVLVNFWYPTCPGCTTEMPKLVDTFRKYEAQGYTTVAVAMNIDPPDYVDAFTRKFGLPFFVAYDADGSLAKAYGDIRLAPTSFLIDKQGRILQRYLGEPDFAQLHRLIETELKKG